MNLTRRQFQWRLLHLLGLMTGLAFFFVCFAGHLGFGFQIGSIFVAWAAAAAAVYFAYLYVMRFLFLSLPRMIFDSLRRRARVVRPQTLYSQRSEEQPGGELLQEKSAGMNEDR